MALASTWPGRSARPPAGPVWPRRGRQAASRPTPSPSSGGPAPAFALNALSSLVLLGTLITWRRPAAPRAVLPRERLLGAMRAGLRFVAAAPAMRAAILRAGAFFFFASAVWALLPLIVRERLGLGPTVFGLMLAVVGAGAVAAGAVMPAVRTRLARGSLVFWATLLACAAMAPLGLPRPSAP